MAEYAESLPFLSRHAERRGHMAELRSRLEAALADRYTIGQEIGRGGMAIVYLAHDLRHDRDVALKVLRPELAATLGPDRFLQEIRLAAGLSHPHILPLHDSGDADGCLFYVMPYVPGESLRDRLEAQGQLPLVEALEIAGEIADALDYAHRAGVIHRDIKPENILLQSGHAAVSDFGIARAISAAGDRRWTAAGIAVGTPDYMSPEQAAGAGQIDGRSDLYSLGCVLFEMLAGRPPLALTPPEGPKAGPVLARDRLAELAVLRPSVPREVAGVVARLLAVAPSDRFETAAEAMDALRAPGEVWTPQSVTARRRRRVGVGVATVAVLGALVGLLLPKMVGAGLNPSLYTIVPFVHLGPVTPTLDGDKCQLLLSTAFTRWEDVTVVNDPLVNDFRSQHGFANFTLESALQLARERRSGWLVWGTVWQLGDSTFVKASLYDVGRDRADREYTIHVAGDLSDASDRFAALADSLLLGVPGQPDVKVGSMGTRKRDAWRAFVEGKEALAGWNLDGADSAFHRALAIDPHYPDAALWLAQVEQWSRRPVEAWRRTAEVAAAGSRTLGTRDRMMVTGLLALADARYPQACDAYRRIVGRDTTDFIGWFGLGECRSHDSLVVRDSLSPSRWSFRSSYHAAADAYAHSQRLVPSSYRLFGDKAFERLSDLLFMETSTFRGGYAAAPDTEFGAFPSLLHDTLAFVPYPLDQAVSDLRTFPATTAEAVRRNRVTLRSMTEAWLQAFPASPVVLETHAMVLETMGEVARRGSPKQSALDAVHLARQQTHDSLQALRLAVAEARLLIKIGSFGAARAILDSTLDAGGDGDPPPDFAALLAGPALLLGHADRAARLTQIGYRDSVMEFTVKEQPAVMDPAWALLAYASAGGPHDSILTLQRRVQAHIDAYVAPERREQARVATLDMPAVEAFPELGVSARHRERTGRFTVLRLQYYLSREDTAAVRATLDSLWTARNSWTASSVTIDGIFLESSLYAKMGDTTSAVRVLDSSLEALLNLDTNSLTWMTMSGDLVRAMVLRARLAAAVGDRSSAAKWASAVVALWSGADAEFRPLVDSMRTLAGTRAR